MGCGSRQSLSAGSCLQVFNGGSPSASRRRAARLLAEFACEYLLPVLECLLPVLRWVVSALLAGLALGCSSGLVLLAFAGLAWTCHQLSRRFGPSRQGCLSAIAGFRPRPSRRATLRLLAGLAFVLCPFARFAVGFAFGLRQGLPQGPRYRPIRPPSHSLLPSNSRSQKPQPSASLSTPGCPSRDDALPNFEPPGRTRRRLRQARPQTPCQALSLEPSANPVRSPGLVPPPRSRWIAPVLLPRVGPEVPCPTLSAGEFRPVGIAAVPSLPAGSTSSLDRPRPSPFPRIRHSDAPRQPAPSQVPRNSRPQSRLVAVR